MTVDQNLRLNITGQLTEDIFVRAFLSDDNLPVVPEGNTEELRDIDKVLVELQAPHWQATLGDFVARRTGTVFGDYQRKLQGMSVNARGGPGTPVGPGRVAARAIQHPADPRRGIQSGTVLSGRRGWSEPLHRRRQRARDPRRRRPDPRRGSGLHHRLRAWHGDLHLPAPDHGRVGHRGGVRGGRGTLRSHRARGRRWPGLHGAGNRSTGRLRRPRHPGEGRSGAAAHRRPERRRRGDPGRCGR